MANAETYERGLEKDTKLEIHTKYSPLGLV
jgi:hypothetical protein